MVDVINDPFKEKSKYYFKIGEALGKAIVKKEGYLKNTHRKLMLNIGNYPPKEKLEKLLDLTLKAEIQATQLCELFDADDKTINQAVGYILMSSMKPIVESNEK